MTLTPMAKSDTLKPLLLATLAFVLAWLGQTALSGSPKMNGWILYGGAADETISQSKWR